MKTVNSIAVPSFELPNKENLLHIFHKGKRSHPFLRKRKLFLNFKSERNVSWRPLCMKHWPSYIEDNGQNLFLNDSSSLMWLSYQGSSTLILQGLGMEQSRRLGTVSPKSPSCFTPPAPPVPSQPASVPLATLSAPPVTCSFLLIISWMVKEKIKLLNFKLRGV